MQKRAVSAVALLVLLAVAPADAQGAGQEGGFVRIEDPAGDVEASLLGVALGNPGGHYDYLDIVAVTVQEGREEIEVGVQVVSLEVATQSAYPDGGVIRIHFVHEDTEFRVQFFRCILLCGETPYFAALHARAVGTESWSHLWGTSNPSILRVDPSSDSVRWALPRELLLDQNGAAPFPGRQLTDIHAFSAYLTSTASIGLGPLGQVPLDHYEVIDDAPDIGLERPALDIGFGIEQTGYARLSSLEPFRASNGEATTFLFNITARNVGEREDTFHLSARNAPSAWGVNLPVEHITLPAGGSRHLPVLVSTPFAHQHGGMDKMLLELHALGDARSVGRLEVGIRYLEIPQPAGHHDTLTFHSRAPAMDLADPCSTLFDCTNSAYMNTLEIDERGTGNPVSAWSYGTSIISDDTAMVSTFRWILPLDPALRMGLDFDTQGTGTVVFPVQSQLPLQSAVLRGELRVLGPQDTPGFVFGQGGTVLATFESEPVEIPANAQHAFELDVHPTPESDLIPYHPANQLVLVVDLQAQTPQLFFRPGMPLMVPGGWMQLPLHEYRDPIEDIYSVFSGPHLHVQGETSRMLNPGGIAVFRMEMQDLGDAAGRYHLAAAGLNAGWASFPRGTTVDLPARGSVTFPVHVHVPEGAFHGEIADIFVQAVHAQDGTQRALARIVVDVDTSRDHPDDSAIAAADMPSDKRAPGLPAVLLLAGLALLGAVRRRRS